MARNIRTDIKKEPTKTIIKTTILTIIQMNIIKYYPDLSPRKASMANLAASTTAGIIFLSVYREYFNSPVIMTALLITGMIIDSATVPYVHKGNISKRYREMKYSDTFFKIHVPSAAVAYGAMILFIISLYTYRIDGLYWIFMVSWHIVYFTGMYAYSQVTDMFN